MIHRPALARALPLLATRGEYPLRRDTAALGERLLLKLMARIAVGQLSVVLTSGARHEFVGATPGPAATITLSAPVAAWRLLLGGANGFADAYVDGYWRADDLPCLLELAALNSAALGPSLLGSLWHRLLTRLAHARNANSRRGSQQNVERHYDLGNAFFAAWLDSSLTYSSALFEKPGLSLEEAQAAKNEKTADWAGIAEGSRVLEVGCGWGAFAELAARRGAFVDAITLSAEQLEYARGRIAAAGLGKRARISQRDYRDIEGHHDAIVSIEMIEAVGESYWPLYFETLARALKPRGHLVLQAIVIADDHFETYRRRPDFIQRQVFPGGMLPCRNAILRDARASGLALMREASFGADYARTLSIWRERFHVNWPAIAAQGFDERFRRLWDYYLAYCIAGFRTGRVNVLHLAFSHANRDQCAKGAS